MKAYLVPHVPFMLPELGGDKLRPYMTEIQSSFDLLAEELEEDPPYAIIICSPHFQGQTFEIGMAKEYKGDLRNFKRPDVIDKRSGNIELSSHIQELAEDIGFVAHKEVHEQGNIDYGTIVPLRFLDPDATIPIIPLSVSLGSKKEHFLWGQQLAKFTSEISENIIFIASTELTQDFKQDPRAYPDNSEEDMKFIQYIQDGDLENMAKMPPSYFERVENDLLPTFILAGYGSNLESEVLTYSGLIGCGCAIIEFTK